MMMKLVKVNFLDLVSCISQILFVLCIFLSIKNVFAVSEYWMFSDSADYFSLDF